LCLFCLLVGCWLVGDHPRTHPTGGTDLQAAWDNLRSEGEGLEALEGKTVLVLTDADCDPVGRGNPFQWCVRRNSCAVCGVRSALGAGCSFGSMFLCLFLFLFLCSSFRSVICIGLFWLFYLFVCLSVCLTRSPPFSVHFSPMDFFFFFFFFFICICVCFCVSSSAQHHRIFRSTLSGSHYSSCIRSPVDPSMNECLIDASFSSSPSPSFSQVVGSNSHDQCGVLEFETK
jgi:hypothetical protein